MKRILLFLLLSVSLFAQPGKREGVAIPSTFAMNLGSSNSTKYESVAPKFVSVSSNLLAGWDLTVGWTTNVTIINNISFSSNGVGGVYKDLSLIIGRKYRVIIEVSSTSPSVEIRNGNTATSPLLGTGGGIYDFTASSTYYSFLYIRNTGAGTTTITRLELYESVGSLDMHSNNKLLNPANADFESGSLGSNLLTGDNSTFTSSYGSWISYSSGALGMASDWSGNTGNGIFKLSCTASGYKGARINGLLTVGKLYSISLKVKLLSGDLGVFGLSVGAWTSGTTTTFPDRFRIAPTSTETIYTGIIFATTYQDLYIHSYNAVSDAVILIDDISVKEVLSDWSGTGNCTAFVTGSQKHSGSYSLQATFTASGDANNCLSLASNKFDPISSGLKYTPDIWVYSSVTQNIYVNLGDQTKIQNVTANTWTKVCNTFTATSSTVNQPLKIWATQASTLYVDDVQICEYWPFSFSGWVKTSSNSQVILSKVTGITTSGVGYLFSINASNKLRIGLYDGYSAGQLTSISDYNDNKWHFITIAIDLSVSSNNTAIFIDGNLKAQGTLSQGVSNNTQAFTIGKYSYSNSGYFSGYLGQLQILRNYAMTLSEHQAIYRRGYFRPNPYAVFFQDLRGSTTNELLQDRSGTGNNSTGVNLDINDRIKTRYK